jgi:hypothetical protein
VFQKIVDYQYKSIYLYPEMLPLSVMVDTRALALAPFVERGLRWFTVKFNFKSEGKVKY